MVGLALAAAQVLEREGISVEVVDPRTLRPLDDELIFQSVQDRPLRHRAGSDAAQQLRRRIAYRVQRSASTIWMRRSSAMASKTCRCPTP